MFSFLQAQREEQQLASNEEAAATRARRDFVLEISALLPCLAELQALVGGVFSHQKASVLKSHNRILFGGYARFENGLSERVIILSDNTEGRAIDRSMIRIVIRPAVGQLAFVTSKSIVTAIQVQIAHKQKTDETKEALFHAKQITTAVKDAELAFNSFNEMHGEIPPSIVIAKSQEIKMYLDKALSEARDLLDLAISQALAAELEAAAELSTWEPQPTALSAMQREAIKQAIKLLESTRAKFTPVPAQHVAANEIEQSVASSETTQIPVEQSELRASSFQQG